jgi:cation diffusion facilitator CzcD-associated flavoprotein CzcO
MSEATAEHFDVLVVGAGVSGIGAAVHLQQKCPDKSYVILDSFDTFGGTWVTHTYPGIRSDSDLYTYGYEFKPWTGPPIATGEEILEYMAEVVDEHDLARHIRYRHTVTSADWSSDRQTWTIVADVDGETTYFTCSFLWMCQGYYRHSEGYTPDWPGMDSYEGEIVHPQTWPDDIELDGKQVLVIGSGATAATLVPAIADDCAHVTMLQRSPTYFFPAPNVDELAEMLRPLPGVSD